MKRVEWSEKDCKCKKRQSNKRRFEEKVEKKVRSVTYNTVSHYIIFYIIGLIISRSRTNPQAMFFLKYFNILSHFDAYEITKYVQSQKIILYITFLLVLFKYIIYFLYPAVTYVSTCHHLCVYLSSIYLY